jgi:hypothetical protein
VARLRTLTRRGPAATLAALTVAACAAPAAPAAEPPGWRPDLAAAQEWAKSRRGDVAFVVRTSHHVWSVRAGDTAPAASLLKTMLLVAYLRQPSVRGRDLRPDERALLDPMIRRSDNIAATRVRDIVGTAVLESLARRTGMRSFRAHPVWGMSTTTAGDQARFMLGVDRHVPVRHRRYAMSLLRTVVPAQRWGVARVAPLGWTLYFKGGWGSGTGRVDHQAALLVRGGQRVALAIVTQHQGSHAYGKQTLQGVAARLLRGLAAAPV